jgi:alpha-D-ribose 1-methylphosphonate 5-triphosphate synthase subunit PhnH
MAMTITPTGAALPPTDETFRDPVRANQHIFRVLLDALANPGTARPLIVHPQVAAEDLAIKPYVASALVTMLDHEVTLHIAHSDDASDLQNFIVRRTRVEFAREEEADFIVADTSLEASLPERLKRGGLEYPDDGATLIISGIGFATPADADLVLTLSGPGIPETRTLHLTDLDPEVIASRNRAVANYPTGIDVLLIDEAGTVVGIPRTTVVTITQEGGR